VLKPLHRPAVPATDPRDRASDSARQFFRSTTGGLAWLLLYGFADFQLCEDPVFTLIIFAVTLKRHAGAWLYRSQYDETGQFVSERSRRSALPGGRAETPQRRNRRTRVSWPAAACERCNRSRSIRRRNTIAAGGARVCRARDAVVHVVARSASRPDQAARRGTSPQDRREQLTP